MLTKSHFRKMCMKIICNKSREREQQQHSTAHPTPSAARWNLAFPCWTDCVRVSAGEMPEHYLKSLFEYGMWRNQAEDSLQMRSRKAAWEADREISTLSTGIFLDYLNLVNRLNIEHNNCCYSQKYWESLGLHPWLRRFQLSEFWSLLPVKLKLNITLEINSLCLCTQLTL